MIRPRKQVMFHMFLSPPVACLCLPTGTYCITGHAHLHYGILSLARTSTVLLMTARRQITRDTWR